MLKTNISTLPTVTASFASLSLPSNGLLVITADAAPSFTANWAKIVSTGGTVSASAYFDLTNGAGTLLYSRVGVPASEADMAKFTIPRVRNVDAGLDVGFALVNTGTASATLDATLRSPTGSAIATKSLTLAAGAHTAMFAREFFALTGEAAGTNYSFMVFESTSAQFAATALAIEGGSLSSFPVSIPGSSGAAATGEFVDGSVTTAKLGAAAVTADKLATGAVTTDKIADSTITGAKVASGQVVKSINSLKDVVTITAGTNVTITPTGNTLSIAASGAAGPQGPAGSAGPQGPAGSGKVFLDRNFQDVALTPFPGVTVASLSLPAGTYVIIAKFRYRNTGTTTQTASCVYQGSGIGGFDSSQNNVPPGGAAAGQIDGVMMDIVTKQVGDNTDVHVQCFGPPDVHIINSQFVAVASAITSQ